MQLGFILLCQEDLVKGRREKRAEEMDSEDEQIVEVEVGESPVT